MSSVGKHIDLDKMLTINFQGATVPLVDSGDKLGIQRDGTGYDKYEEYDLKCLEASNKCTILKHHPFWGSGVRYKYNWEEVMQDHKLKYKKYHTVTINMDPSKLNYSSQLSSQKCALFDVIYKYQNKIKYLALVYEYGKGKLHWHFILNIQSIKEMEEDLQKEFGKGHAVVIKKIQPNNNETLEENVTRYLKYLQKEEHNKQNCLLYKY